MIQAAYMENMNGLKKAIKELLDNNDIPAENKKSTIALMNSFVRADQSRHRYSEYFKNGYYFGYFLIQSQKIETRVKSLVGVAESLKAISEKRAVRNIDLNIPLGALIKTLEKYIISEEVFGSLREFNNFRINVIHRLYEDFSQDLSDIESSVSENFPPEKINKLDFSLIGISYKINSEIMKHLKSVSPNLEAVTYSEKELKELFDDLGWPDVKFAFI